MRRKKLKIKYKILTLVVLAFFTFGTGCATLNVKKDALDSDFKITKVHRFINKISLELGEQSFSQSYGIDKFLSDAETLPEEKRGEKLIITWKYKGKEVKEAIRLQLQYKTSKEDTIKKIEERYQNLKKGKYSYTLKHLGQDFKKQGPIAIWYIALLDGGNTVAEKKSRLWDKVSLRRNSLK